MKRFSCLLGFLSLLACAPLMHADTLTLTSVSASSGGEYIYPYSFSVDGSKSTTALMCINLDKTVYVGESWAVTISNVGSLNNANYRADAYIYSQLGNGKYSDSEVQWAAWSILDPSGVKGNSAYDSAAQTLASNAITESNDATLINSGFYNKFVLYAPTTDTTGWTNGQQPQSYIGTAVTPEPSTLALLGTGFSGVGMLIRKRRSAGQTEV